MMSQAMSHLLDCHLSFQRNATAVHVPMIDDNASFEYLLRTRNGRVIMGHEAKILDMGKKRCFEN